MVLEGKIARLIEVQVCYGMEKNVEKTKVMRNSRQPSPLLIKLDQKQLGNVKYFNSLWNQTTNYSRASIDMPKAAFNKRIFSSPNWTDI